MIMEKVMNIAGVVFAVLFTLQVLANREIPVWLLLVGVGILASGLVMLVRSFNNTKGE